MNGAACSKELLKIKSLELLYLIHGHENKDFLEAVSLLRSSPGRRDLKQFMEAHYCKSLRLKDFAMLTGRSISTFVRDFRQAYGLTPNQWVIERRLEKARELLGLDGMTVTDVALAVGYTSSSHFIFAYKKRLGVTPKKQIQIARRETAPEY